MFRYTMKVLKFTLTSNLRRDSSANRWQNTHASILVPPGPENPPHRTVVLFGCAAETIPLDP